jgi:catechol 2,3-dioxygenase-like lactoylglutathione lyase family enzyme
VRFYVDVIGFRIAFERPEELFVYLERGNVHLMLQSANGPGRRFRTAALQQPFGRGVNFQIKVANVDKVYAIATKQECTIVLAIEDRWYRQSVREVGNRQFVIADPDGYLLRLYSDLGERKLCP